MRSLLGPTRLQRPDLDLGGRRNTRRTAPKSDVVLRTLLFQGRLERGEVVSLLGMMTEPDVA